MGQLINDIRESLVMHKAIHDLLNYLKIQNYNFITVSPVTHSYWLKKNPQRSARDLREVFGWGLPFTEQLIDPTLFELLHVAGLITPQENKWKSNIRVSALGEDLFVHSAFPTLEEDSVFFGPDTYRFVHALNLYLTESPRQIRRAVEVCCGASPAAVSIAKQFPSAIVHAIDINPKALKYSEVNAEAAAVKVETIYNNLFHDFQIYFDLIVANPPFMMDKKKRAYRDGGAVFGTELALRIVNESLERLAPNGALILYTGTCIVAGRDVFYEQVKQVLATHSNFDWQYKEIDVDIFSEELLLDGYEKVERIAAVLLHIWKKS